jgi:hypothetical protein
MRILLDKQSIVILPDLSRRCPVVDPDDHHLYVSLGCAAENILQAAAVLQGAFAVCFRKIGMTGFEPAAPSSRTKFRKSSNPFYISIIAVLNKLSYQFPTASGP